MFGAWNRFFVPPLDFLFLLLLHPLLLVVFPFFHKVIEELRKRACYYLWVWSFITFERVVKALLKSCKELHHFRELDMIAHSA